MLNSYQWSLFGYPPFDQPLVFRTGVMWVLRPREESVEPGWKKVVRENNKDDCDPRIPFFDPDRPFGGHLTYRPWIDDD